jgi:hypothetical protein
MIETLIVKLLFIIIFAFAYFNLYKKINYLEERIFFWYFFIFLYIGGSITSLIFDYTDLIFVSSDMTIIKTNVMTWLIFFIIVFVVPYICIYIFKRIMYKNNQILKFRKTNFFFLIIISIFISLYIFISIDIPELINKFSHIKSYTNWIIYRNKLYYSFDFYFIAKSLAFVVLLSLFIELYFRKKKRLAFVFFLIGLILFGLIEHFLFATKGLIFNFAIAYLLVLFFDIKILKFILVGLVFIGGYIGYYAFNMGIGSNYELTNIIMPIVSGLTRFTLTIPAFIEYYMIHDFDMRIYFHSILIGENIISPNIKVYSMLFNNTIDLGNGIYGSLTNNMFTYNYSNFGIFFILKSFFEFIILISIYKKTIVKNEMTTIKLAILFLLLFNILNFEFITILVNPVVGFIYFALFYFIKDTLIPQIIFKRKRINETTTTRS